MQHSADPPSNERTTTYELFIGTLSILSIFNLLIVLFASDQDIRNTVTLIDLGLSLIFLIDFGYRLRTASSKARYFFREAGWADLLASIPAPQFKLLRLFRIWRVAHIMRRYGARHLLVEFLRDRAGSALLSVLLLMILVLEFGSMGVLIAERTSPDSNIRTASDALWWAYVSITTVGYGDRYPVTNLGRLWGTLVVTAGVGLFGVLSGFLANTFLRSQPPAVDQAGVVSAGAPSHDLPGELAAIRQALETQGHGQAALLERLETLERLLTTTQPAATSGAELNSNNDVGRRSGGS